MEKGTKIKFNNTNDSFKVTVLNCIDEKPTNTSLMIIEEVDKKEGEENELEGIYGTIKKPTFSLYIPFL